MLVNIIRIVYLYMRLYNLDPRGLLVARYVMFHAFQHAFIGIPAMGINKLKKAMKDIKTT